MNFEFHSEKYFTLLGLAIEFHRFYIVRIIKLKVISVDTISKLKIGMIRIRKRMRFYVY